MNIQISSKNYTVSSKLRDIIDKKVARLGRYFGDTAEVKVFCRREKDLYKLEVTIRDNGLLLRSEVTGDNMYQNIDLALPKIEKQVIKYSDKLKDKFYKRAAVDARDWLYFEEGEKPAFAKPKVSRRKTFDIVPLSVEDAQMYLENSDHEFYIYLNQETGKVNVMYRRRAGDFGIIEPIY